MGQPDNEAGKIPHFFEQEILHRVAKASLDAMSIREASWFDPKPESLTSGKYTKSMQESCEEAVRNNGLEERWAVIIGLAMDWSNDVHDWASAILKK